MSQDDTQNLAEAIESSEVEVPPTLTGDLTQGGDIKFYTAYSKEIPMLELKANGEFYTQGRKVVRDVEVYDALRKFLVGQGLMV